MIDRDKYLRMGCCNLRNAVSRIKRIISKQNDKHYQIKNTEMQRNK
jgi:hypothetical protein